MDYTTVKKMGERSKYVRPTKKASEYETIAESLSLDEKARILEELGSSELINVFEGWKPRPRKRKRGAPLDQRVSITVTDAEKVLLNNELKSIKRKGDKTTASQIIRNRSLASVDIFQWKEIALKELKRLESIAEQEEELKNRKNALLDMIEKVYDEDEEAEFAYNKELFNINEKLLSLIASNENRKSRLTGRMSMVEAETIKWRAQRLCISTSDYLRMMIFGFLPASSADSHMSLNARRRFYVSILDVAKNGWGSPPNIYECSQCANYLDEIEVLKEQIERLKSS